MATLFTAALGLAGTGGGADIVVHTGVSAGEALFSFSGDIISGTGLAMAARLILLTRVRPPMIKHSNRIKPPLR